VSFHVTSDGARLFVDEVGEGSGPPLLLLHGGLGLDHGYFRPDFDRLGAGRRVLYLDHRGNGRSDESAAPITMQSLADDAAEVISALAGPDGCAAVAGHSFGGFVAQELALAHPEVVERLILLSTTPGQLGAADDPDADQGPPPPPELQALLAQMPTTDAEFEAMADRLLPYYVHGDAAVLRDRAAGTIFRLRPMLEGFASLATWSAVDRLGGLAMPVLLLAGDHDLFTSHQQSERIARLVPHAELHVVAGAGHFPWLERPDLCFSLLEAFLDRGRP
jgi:proline iminopeptidase